LSFEHDIWAAANLLITEYGEYAEIIADVRHDKVQEQGDSDDVLVWKSILVAVRELLSETVPEGGTIH